MTKRIEEGVQETQSTEVIPATTSYGEVAPLVPGGKYRLTDEQKRAAQLLIENDMRPKGKRKKLYEISEEIGVHRDTLLNWRSLPEFNRYRNDAVTLVMQNDQALVYSKLIGMIDQSQPSTRAIQMFFEMTGRLKTKQQVDVTVSQGQQDMKNLSDEELDDIIDQYAEEL